MDANGICPASPNARHMINWAMHTIGICIYCKQQFTGSN